MKVGETVKWSSLANGSETEKIGEVIVVVPAGNLPGRALVKWRERTGYFETLSTQFDVSKPRRVVSYLVLVGDKVYFPRVRHLESVE